MQHACINQQVLEVFRWILFIVLVFYYQEHTIAVMIPCVTTPKEDSIARANLDSQQETDANV